MFCKLCNRNTEMTDAASQQPTLLQSATDLGPVVRERRKSQSLRIDDAAALLGVSHANVSLHEAPAQRSAPLAMALQQLSQ